ncbi:MAG: hypothetical protein EOP53_11955 [Sphingobacteriales bacterium]|nr:MAG: hypothetical protein EOP53_11955 [Sphingobacteriales bacterium]
MKYIYAVILFACLLPKFTFAQYDNIRQPLTPEETARYKKNKVMAELQKIMDNGVAKNYKALAIDTGGRLRASISYLRNQYFLYDLSGNVIAYLDSLRGSDNKFTEKAYYFTYDEQYNKLQKATTPDGEVNFNYDPNTNILTQFYVNNDTLKLTKYHFDSQKRLVLIEGFDHQNTLKQRIDRAYSSNGTLHREEIIGNFPNGADSTIILYQYDGQKHLYKKQVFNYRKFYVNMNNSPVPTHSAEQTSLGTITYTYDKKWNKIAENYTNNVDKLSNYYITWQYNEKGLTTKKTIQKGKNEPDVILYEYSFFE